MNTRGLLLDEIAEILGTKIGAEVQYCHELHKNSDVFYIRKDDNTHIIYYHNQSIDEMIDEYYQIKGE